MIYAILPQKLRERFEQELELDMSYSLPGKARFRVNVYFQRDSIGAAFRLIPFEIKKHGRAGAAGRRGGPRALPARVRRGDRPDRFGQVHDARRDGGRRERGAGRAHHDGGGPDRVPAQAQAAAS